MLIKLFVKKFNLLNEMIELSSVLPEKVITYAKYTVTLQETLMSILPSTIQKSLDKILELPLIHTLEGVKNIANNILLTAQYRPFSISSLAKLSIELKKAGQSNDNKLKELTSIFLIIPVKILDEKWKVVFLYEGYKNGLFTDEELFTAIKKYFDAYPILKSKPFWKNNSRQHYLFFQWFAPLFEKMDKNLYEETKNSFFECYENHHLTSNYENYMSNFEQLRANDWCDYKKLLDNHYVDGSVSDIIRKDNVEELQKILLKASSSEKKRTQNIQFLQQQKTQEDTNPKTEENLSPEEKQLRSIIDWRIESTMFEFVTMLTRKPTLAHFAAFCGSEKCFNYLVEHGANLELNDYGKRNSLYFAIAGGNSNIIRKVEEVVRDFKGATRIAAEYHRFDLFKILLDESHANLKANDIENGSIFHGIAAANHIKMILFCLEQGCDCNLKDGDGVCIKKKKKDLVKMNW